MKSIIYYTDNRLTDPLYTLVQEYLLLARLPIFSASLKPIEFGDNEVIDGERGYPTMIRQIISCLSRSNTKYVFFCEHDVLYHTSHFEFTPPRDDIFYYNENFWRWLQGSDTVIRHDRMLSLSSLCVNREFALDHYERRLKRIVDKGWDKPSERQTGWERKMGYEPGQKKKRRGGFSNDDFETWSSQYACIDVRHPGTLSPPKTKLSEFKHEPKWWTEKYYDSVYGWNMELIKGALK